MSLAATNTDVEIIAAGQLTPQESINREHKLARQSADTAIEHAIRCGELLIAQKAELKHGEFKPWIAENCDFIYESACGYMKVAEVTKHIGMCGLWHKTEHMDAEWLLHHFGDPGAESWRKWDHVDSFHIPFSAYACKAPHEKPYAGCRTCYPETLTIQPVSATMNQLHREVMFHSAIAENLGKAIQKADVVGVDTKTEERRIEAIIAAI